MSELDWVRRLRPEAEADADALARERTAFMATLEEGDPLVSNPPPGTPQIIPHIPYENVPAAIEWLEEAFGFSEIEGSRIESPGSIHVAMSIGSGRIMLGTPGGHGAFPPKGSGSPSLMLTVYVENVDAHCARAQASGGRVCSELEDKFYGDRVYEVFDLEGHRWSFHEHTGRRFPMDEPPPEED